MNNSEAITVRNRITQYFASGKIDEGRSILNNVQDDLPPAIRFECLGNLAFYKRQFNEAIRLYELGIGEDSKHYSAGYQYLMGVKNERERDLPAAFERYKSAILLDATFVDAYVALGALMISIGEPEASLKYLRDAVNLSPNDIVAWQDLRVALSKLAAVRPTDYSDELHAANDVVKKLRAAGSSLSDGHVW